MTVESDNPLTGGTDNDTPHADDTAESWDYFDPDEDQDNETVADDSATDDGEQAAVTEPVPVREPALDGAHATRPLDGP